MLMRTLRHLRGHLYFLRGHFTSFSPCHCTREVSPHMLRCLRYVIIAAVFASFVITAREAHGVVIDKIVAVVNGEIITQREIAWHLIPMYEQYRKEYTGRRLEKKMTEAEDAVLNQLIDDKLVLSEAKNNGIEVTNKESESKLQTVKNNFGTEDQFRDALAIQNITLSELRSRFKNEIMKSKIVRKEIGWNITITPSEVREYYDTHIDEFKIPGKADVRNILIRKEDSGRTKKESRFLIEKIKELLEKGEDFGEIAKEYSEGPNAKEGGDLSSIEKGQMIKKIDDAVFSLEGDGISDIVESSIGYHIFEVTKKVPAKVIEFKIARPEIEDLLYKRKIDKRLKKWLNELRKNAYISIK